ncbi:TRAP transporter large permease subunit [Salinicoccus hispanicus]|uniref:TRAP transporter large permease subunit n=1 Tax=Salinicoccus hispanicus TaxID=157225 RepID=A0A6N8TWR2_9STAP|nr:TRAP transporter large permease subunit [Salinicoccus hispanicus]
MVIGFVTPPLSMNLFVALSLIKVQIEKRTITVISFIIVIVICLMLIALTPHFSMWNAGLT